MENKVNTELSHSDKLSPPASSSLTDIVGNEAKWYCKISNWIKITLLIICLSLLIVIFIYGKLTIRIVTQFLDWMKENLFVGSLAFIIIYIICNLLMIPGFFLTIGAGFTFVNAFESHSWSGIICAILVVSTSRIFGATLAFLNGRYLFSNSMVSWLRKYDRFVVINEIIKLQSFKVCFLLRLSPITPYGLLNYLMAIATDVNFKSYFWGTFGMIPDSITYCLVGASVASISELSSVSVSSNFKLLIVTGFMTLLSFIGIIYIGCVAKKELMRLSRIVENDLRVKQITIDSDTIVDIDQM